MTENDPNDPNDLAGDIRDFLRRRVAVGFDRLPSMMESAVEVYSAEADEETVRPLVERLAGEVAAAHAREQADWPDVTDCDRLDDAFAELTRGGIVARQNFTCCGTCGVSEIGDEMQAEEDAGVAVRGYAFYHMQDTEAAADGYGLYLNYGAVMEDDLAEVGREVVAGLQKHGLTPTWNGRTDTRIHVHVDWKRRRAYEVGG